MAPIYAVKVHTHVNELALTWPPNSAFGVDEPVNVASPGLADIRPLVVIGDLTCFTKLGEVTSFIGFLQKSGFWLVPPPSPVSTKKVRISSLLIKLK